MGLRKKLAGLSKVKLEARVKILVSGCAVLSVLLHVWVLGRVRGLGCPEGAVIIISKEPGL